MKSRLSFVLLALTLGACAAPAPQPATTAKADSCAEFDAAMPDQKPADPSVKRSCWGKPQTNIPRSLIKSSYPSAEALKADLAKEISAFAVTLDGELIRAGYGPAISYRSQPDGSVSR